ncbi:hypothetical protein [Micromonospora chersina]|uniref:hypothetical protein n=1 Tax=Micromonospora chersina TaxID=47854 RepID=UPI0037237016
MTCQPPHDPWGEQPPPPTATPLPAGSRPRRQHPAVPTKPTTEPIRTGVHAGAFCSPAGALGRTSTGKLMRCKTSATDSRLRWRAA